MTFPTPHTVDWFPYIGGPASVDELGNEVESWSETPTSVAVQGWQDSIVESLQGQAAQTGATSTRAQGAISEVALSAPPDWIPSIRDRVALPDKGTYEVVGIDLQCKGFHNWKPGNLVLLKNVKGI